MARPKLTAQECLLQQLSARQQLALRRHLLEVRQAAVVGQCIGWCAAVRTWAPRQLRSASTMSTSMPCTDNQCKKMMCSDARQCEVLMVACAECLEPQRGSTVL